MRPKEKLKNLISKFPRLEKALAKFFEHPILYIVGAFIIIYLYGIVIHSFIAAFGNFTSGAHDPTFTLNPIKCIEAAFTPQGLGVIFFLFIMYALISGKWLHLITGVKITKDERNFFVSSEGTHGTGHCSFTTSLDGKTDVIVYHAMRTPNGGWGARGVRAQTFTWDGDMPVFGKAAGLDDEIEIN